MTVPIRPTELSLTGIRQALQRIELNRRTGPQHDFTATSDPTTDEDESQGYSGGSLIYNVLRDRLFFCTDATKGRAVWENPFGPGIIAATGASEVHYTLLAGEAVAF
jgi:hypothetical protein